jgi:sulfur carrier protein
MNITINGEPMRLNAATVAAALEKLGYGDAAVATALNGDIVLRQHREETPLREGDALEIVAPMAGG